MTDANTLFQSQEWLRYLRHVQLPGFGAEGQLRLKNAHVLIVGMGGLGSPVSLYLAAAGVGKLTIFDGDEVDITNLQRQVLFAEGDVGKPKVEVAKEKLNALNSDININAKNEHFSASVDIPALGEIDLVLDCTDNFPTRYLINDICVQYQLPWVYASVHQYAGQCAFFAPGDACFRCLFPESPTNIDDCNAAGVIGVLPGLLGLLQANEALKYLAGQSVELKNTLLLFDAARLSMQKIALKADKNCCCRQHGFAVDANSDDYVFECKTENSHPIEINCAVFNRQREKEKTIVLDVRSDQERQAFHIGGQHIPVDELEQRLSELAPGEYYLCYCQSGGRSLRAAETLIKSGKNALSLEGGLGAWLKAQQST